jgi:hypothetical protein
MIPRKPDPFLRAARIAAVFLLILAGCSRAPQKPKTAGPAAVNEREVAPGVMYRHFPAEGANYGAPDAFVLDVDLRAPGVSVRVASDNPAPNRGPVYADSYTVSDWCARCGAVAGINGGFFGQTDGARKEVVGLLATDGILRASGRVVRRGGRRIVRCVLGFDAKGTPRIGWAVGERGRVARLTDYAAPLNPAKRRSWNVSSAVACGPRLIRAGRKNITDREERLVSPPPLRRTFVGYSVENGRPRHLVLAVGLAMTFSDAADFLQQYFRQYHQQECAEAMALDGGASSQLVYRTANGYADAAPTFVAVPTAILVTAQK